MKDQRKRFGTRFLTDEREVFRHNAWDNVEWNAEQKAEAECRIVEQRQTALSFEEARCLLKNPAEQWNNFYRTHGSKFFMDRNWLVNEFPELDGRQIACKSPGPLRILDVGCGVGNATIPLLQKSESFEKVFVYACDFSQEAVEILKQRTTHWSDKCQVFVWDITGLATDAIPPESLDVVLCVYVLSALPPESHQRAVVNLARLLKPGGVMLVKDYSRFDMTQLRFKDNRMIDENFYRRGDGTLVYFFTQDELHRLFVEAGLKKEINIIDRRLIVNRAKLLKMYRMWVQCKYVKNALQ